jgi:hypothetical protein
LSRIATFYRDARPTTNYQTYTAMTGLLGREGAKKRLTPRREEDRFSKSEMPLYIKNSEKAK